MTWMMWIAAVAVSIIATGIAVVLLAAFLADVS